MDSPSSSCAKRSCRVAVVGAHRQRVINVVKILHMTESMTYVDYQSKGAGKKCRISLHYLPCVATFGSYANQDGQAVRYLASVEYHPDDSKRGSSLAPFFDAGHGDDIEEDLNLPSFPGISAVAIGCGIEAEQDVSMIETFVNTLARNSTCTLGESDSGKSVLIECIKPNPEYCSMKEESAAYKALDGDAKEEAARFQTLGPSKMAKFTADLAARAIKGESSADPEVDAADIDPVAAADELDKTGQFQRESFSRELDPARPKYACRMCRMVLFGDEHLEDPPHVPSKHHFSPRKLQHQIGASTGCESLFLNSALSWMGDTSAPEGKFGCPKCGSKLGHWKWAGAQCSCGTWVTPAIQVPRTRVDVVETELSKPETMQTAVSPRAVSLSQVAS